MEELHLGQSIASSGPGDLEYFRSLCENEEGWYLSYDKDLTVHGRSFPGSDSKCLRVCGHLGGVSADTMFDFMSDDEYRTTWDTVADSFYDISLLDRHNSLGYYCLKCPFPLQKRDVVFQRTWGHIPNGYVIMNHSVSLPEHPPLPGIVRATSLITGYLMADTEDGCSFTYLSHSDPKVTIPQWLCNRVGTYVAPAVFRKLQTAAKGYGDWKRTHRPAFKPWRCEEQRSREDYADPVSLAAWGFPIPGEEVCK